MAKEYIRLYDDDGNLTETFFEFDDRIKPFIDEIVAVAKDMNIHPREAHSEATQLVSVSFMMYIIKEISSKKGDLR